MANNEAYVLPEKGDIICFGRYPYEAGGKEAPLEWLVLRERRDDVTGHIHALILSLRTVDVRAFNEKGHADWQRCSLRTWLNSDFIKTAFTEEEQKAIEVTDVENTRWESFPWGVEPDREINEDPTADRIFLLSSREFDTAFPNGKAAYIMPEPTPYTLLRGARTFFYEGAPANCWWLRSPDAYYEDNALILWEDADATGVDPGFKHGVRPALWLDMTEAKPALSDGTLGCAEEEKDDPSMILNPEGRVLLSYHGQGGAVRVPDGVVIIADSAFELCDHVTSVFLPDSVQRICDRAFRKSGITSIRLPDGLNRIGEYAFQDTPLEQVTIPDSVERIGICAFSGANKLEKAVLSAGTDEVPPGMFRYCSSLKEVFIPEGVVHIEGAAFEDCTSLKKVHLPQSLQTIWKKSFSGCTSLEEILLGDKVKVLGDRAFANCYALKRMHIPLSLKEYFRDVFEGDKELMLEGPGVRNGAVYSGDSFCFGSPALTELTIPKGIRDVGSALSDLRELRYLKFPEGFIQIDTSSLKGLRKLEVLELPKSLKYYDWRAFSDLCSLKKIVTVPKALAAEIALLLDLECTDAKGNRIVFRVPERGGQWLTEPDPVCGGLRLTGSKGKIGFTGYADLTTIVLPDSVDGKPITSIGEEAFRCFSGIDAVYIPDSVKQIGARAFYGTRHLMFARLPKDVEIGEDAFSDTGIPWPRAENEEAENEKGEDIEPVEKEPDDRKVINEELARLCAEAVDDPSTCLGARGRPNLKANIWDHFNRLNREEKIGAMMHDVSVFGEIDGIGWASVYINVDGERTQFRISEIGASLNSFRKFVKGIADGDTGYFGWSAEPGHFGWEVQRCGKVFYIIFPRISNSIFYPRERFLNDIEYMDQDW